MRARLGITYDQLAPLNDRLIYASFTGYGEKGEEANKPGFDSNAYWARSGLMDLVRADQHTTPARSVAGMGDHPCAMAFYGAIVTALYKRERTGKGSHVSSNLMANGVWAASVLAQAKLVRRQVRRAAAARARAQRRDQPLSVQGRPLADPVAAERGPAMADAGALPRPRGFHHRSPFCDQDGPPRAVAGTDQDLRRAFSPPRTSPNGARILDGNGLVFGVVGILDDIPNDKQMIENEVLVPFENDTMLTINSPIWVDGSQEGAAAQAARHRRTQRRDSPQRRL